MSTAGVIDEGEEAPVQGRVRPAARQPHGQDVRAPAVPQPRAVRQGHHKVGN